MKKWIFNVLKYFTSFLHNNFLCTINRFSHINSNISFSLIKIKQYFIQKKKIMLTGHNKIMYRIITAHKSTYQQRRAPIERLKKKEKRKKMEWNMDGTTMFVLPQSSQYWFNDCVVGCFEFDIESVSGECILSFEVNRKMLCNRR